jgi:hypothetical protein
MNVTIQELVGRLTSQEPIDDWPPEVPPRPLRSFADLPDIPPQELERLNQPDEVADPLRLLGAAYQNEEYRHVRHFFRNNPDQLGDEGKLLSVLAYLQLSRDKPNMLERYAAPLVKELVASEPSEFAPLYEWFQNFVQERPMPQAFQARSSGCK